MKSEDVCRWLEEGGVIPVVRAPNAGVAARAVEALLAGGLSIIEITLTVPDAVSLIGSLARRYGDRVLVGAGTVLTADEAMSCIDAGARFVVSPGLDAPTVEATLRRGGVAVPGAMTPSEVIRAWKVGGHFVKVFPCNLVGGAKFIRALRGPLPRIKLVPTGGVNAENAGEYIAAGASAVGVGGELVDLSAIAAGKDDVVVARARELVGAVRRARAAVQGAGRPS